MRYILLASVLLFSCSEKEDLCKISSLQHNLRFLLNEDQRIINIINVRRNGNPSAGPYLELADSLNKLILKNIDTTFSNIESDSNKIKARMKEISEKYLKIYLALSSTPKCKFLLSDDSLIRRPVAEFRPMTGDKLMNHYLLMQNMLFTHTNVLRLCDGCFGNPCRMWRDTEHDGFMVNSLQHEKGIKVKCHFNYPKWIASYELIDFIDLKDRNGRSIRINDLERTENDTLKFSLAPNAPKDLTICLSYDVTDRFGDQYKRELKFPVTLW